MKINLVLIICLLIAYKSDGQNCFNIISNASGYEMSNEKATILDSLACQLKRSLPNRFEEDFQISFIDFYELGQYYKGGHPLIFKTALDEIKMNYDFFVLIGFGQDNSGNLNFHIELKLPTSDSLNCLNPELFPLIENNMKNILISEYENLGKNIGELYFVKAKGLEYLTNYIIDKIQCCDLGNRSNSECGNCIAESTMIEFLEDNGFKACSNYPLFANPKNIEGPLLKEYAEIKLLDGLDSISLNEEIRLLFDELKGVVPSLSGDIRFYFEDSDCLSIIKNTSSVFIPPQNGLYLNVNIVGLNSIETGPKLAIKINTNINKISGRGNGTLYFLNLDNSYNTSAIIDSTKKFFNLAGLNIKTQLINSSSNFSLGTSDGIVVIGKNKSKVVKYVFLKNEICNLVDDKSHTTLLHFMEEDDPMNPEVSPNPVILVSTSDLGPLYINWDNIEKTNRLNNNPNRLIAFIILHGTAHLAGFVHNPAPKDKYWEGYGYIANGEKISEYIKDYNPKLNFEAIIKYTKEDIKKVITLTNERFK